MAGLISKSYQKSLEGPQTELSAKYYIMHPVAAVVRLSQAAPDERAQLQASWQAERKRFDETFEGKWAKYTKYAPMAAFGAGVFAGAGGGEAAAEFVGPPESIPGVGGVGIGGPGDVAAAAWDPIAAAPTATDTLGKIGGGLDTLANYADKVGGIIGKVGGIFGGIFGGNGEDQPTTVQPSTPASTQPLTSSSEGLIPSGSTGGIVLETAPAAEQPNYALYAGLAILAIILLKGI